MKQTSIEWLIQELKLEGYDHTIALAKEKHKEEIVEAWYDGAQSDPLPTGKNAERYYDRVYGKR